MPIVSLILITNIGQKLAEKEPLGLKYITANPFPYSYTLPENYRRQQIRDIFGIVLQHYGESFILVR